MTTPSDAPDSIDTIVALMEETLTVSRETNALAHETNTKVGALESYTRQIGVTVDRHDEDLYRAEKGGIVGRLERIEDRVNAKIDAARKEADAAISTAKTDAANAVAAVRAEIAPMRWVGLIVGGAVIMWLVTQGLTLIKP